MAFTRNGNTIYATSADVLVGTYTVMGIIFQATAANGLALVSDSTSASPAATEAKIPLGAPGSKEIIFLDFSNMPVRFERGISVGTISSGAICIILREIGRQ